ncbi:MAG: LacI family transcriptional regulator [Bryobacteraceae bacterium]|nr:LacI family transcriptional regulator [Bryobacteraceae bacterium]
MGLLRVHCTRVQGTSYTNRHELPSQYSRRQTTLTGHPLLVTLNEVRQSLSIKDVARIANVSHSTVSRALRDSPLVNPETAARIKKIALESSYRASAVARSLATSKTHTLGVVVATVADPFIAEVISGIEAAARQRGYSVFLANSDGVADRETSVVESFEERRVEGILVLASRVGSSYRTLLEKTSIPIVLINNYKFGDCAYSVDIDNVPASREATRHLIGLGHRRIAYLGDRFGFNSDTERFSGYRQELAAADIAFRPEFVVHGDGTPPGGEAAVQQLMQLPGRPTAVFCYDDMTALGALRGIRAAGLRVPEDVSVVGFDDLLIASYVEPALTTIRQPKEHMGTLATEMILNLLSGEKGEANVKVAGELIVRKSACPPAVP